MDADTSARLPDWQLPPGVDRALWDYVTRQSIATEYDELFSDTALLHIDERFLLQHAPPPPARFLDLGCGSGRTLVAMARAGYECTGVDLSQPMLDVAAEKLSQQGYQAELIAANLCELPVGEGPLAPASIDVGCCLFATLGMIRGYQQRLSVLQHAAQVIRPDGLLVLHVHNLWSQWHTPSGRRWLFADFRRRLTGSEHAGDVQQPSYRGIPNLTMHLFTLGEIDRMLRRAGFHRTAVKAVGSVGDDELSKPWLLPRLRATGWLVAAKRAK